MPEQPTHCHSHSWKLFPYLAACFLASGSAFAQSNQDPAIHSDHAPDKVDKITLKGCLGGNADRYNFAAVGAHGPFILTGHTSGLEKYIDREMILEGRRGDPIPVEGFFEPFPSFEVARIVEVIDKRVPTLSPSFSNTSRWHSEINRMYGVKLAHPDSMDAMQTSESPLVSNFVTEKGVTSVTSFGIPGEVYSDANFRGGFFSISVNRNVTNQLSCSQFGISSPQEPQSSQYVVGELRYSQMDRGSAAMGTWYGDYYFHIFQNGLCYELAFQLVTYSARTADTGCNVPLLSQEDELELIKPLIASVSFFRPSVAAAHDGDSRTAPRVTEFSASSQTADLGNRGLITFSWSTQDADYVELTYTCPNPLDAQQKGVSSVVISENGPNRYCMNTESFKTFSLGHFYHSPDSSVEIGFGYFNHDDPTSVVVTITPFSHGTPYPDSSKSLSVIVNPYNPFQRGIPTDTRNMTLTYAPAADGAQNYEQGSPLKIIWTDARTQDPCVNLYLVQDNGAGGENYLLQINGTLEIGCLKPASSGSYAWTVPTKYSGSGFRVLARTPGGFSGTLGAPFNIVKNPPDVRPQ
jgi:hypothetical protein